MVSGHGNRSGEENSGKTNWNGLESLISGSNQLFYREMLMISGGGNTATKSSHFKGMKGLHMYFTNLMNHYNMSQRRR
ncbi:hypothetical protein Ancab_031544 [Ancistrocladus abbreviatus]